MNMYVDEEVMWQRLKDIQREAENRRIFAQHTVPGLLRLVSAFGPAVWRMAHALGLVPRWWATSEAPATDEDAEANASVA